MKSTPDRKAALRSSIALRAVVVYLPLLACVCNSRKGLSSDSFVFINRRGDQATWAGEIVDFTGRELTLRSRGGTELRIPTDKVVRLESPKSDAHRQADLSYDSGNYTQALNFYHQAVRIEPRRWMQRRLASRIVLCLRNLGQLRRAGTTFLGLIKDDSATQYFDTIPLAWRPTIATGELTRVAESWLIDEGQPAAQLMAASWLLSGNKRASAMQALRSLSRGKDARLTTLAKAQLWRTQLATINEQQIDLWQQMAASMPASLRAGPYYLVGKGLSRLGHIEDAIISLLKVPILFPDDHALAAESLWEAAQLLQQQDKPDEAKRLVAELQTRFPSADAARQLRRDGNSRGLD